MRSPTFHDLLERNLSLIEKELHQRTPPHDKAFNRVLATTLALGHAGLYQLAEEVVRQNFATTAVGNALLRLGEEYGLTPRSAVAARLEVAVPLAPEEPHKIAITSKMTLTAGDRVFHPLKETTLSVTDSHIVFPIVSVRAGTVDTLLEGEELLLSHDPLLEGKKAKVVQVLEFGRDAESEEVFRTRLLERKRFPLRGGTTSHYRQWAKRSPLVNRAFPYFGDYRREVPALVPPHRTVFAEPVPSLEEELYTNPKRRSAFLREVKQMIVFALDGSRNEPLGLGSDTLHVLLPSRFFLVIRIVTTESLSPERQKVLHDRLADYVAQRAPYIEETGDTEEKSLAQIDIAAITQESAQGSRVRSCQMWIDDETADSEHTLIDRRPLLIGEVARLKKVVFA